VAALKDIVKYKQAKAHDANSISILDHNNDVIKNVLRNICSANKQKNTYDKEFLSFIKIMENASVAVLRDKVYKMVFPLIYVFFIDEAKKN